MAYTDESFFETIKPYVLEDMRQSGILASLTAAQAHVESEKGNSGLTIKANNLFGIKGNYQGQSVKMLTTEYYNGAPYKVMADFRKYPSWAESIADHSAMFNRMKRYANLRGCTDYKQACKNVEADGYATSIDQKTGKPNYASTLLSRIEKFHLYEWDQEVLNGKPVESSEPNNHNPYNEPTKNVKYGSRGNDVRWVQFALNHWYYEKTGLILGLNVDGDFKDKTKLAVIECQKLMFPEDSKEWDGIVGVKTREKLKA